MKRQEFSEYYVQIGSWKNTNYAQEVFVKIKKYYPEAYMEKQNNLNKIRIPGVITEEQGSDITKDIEEKFKLQPFLVLKSQ